MCFFFRDGGFSYSLPAGGESDQGAQLISKQHEGPETISNSSAVLMKLVSCHFEMAQKSGENPPLGCIKPCK